MTTAWNGTGLNVRDLVFDKSKGSPFRFDGDRKDPLLFFVERIGTDSGSGSIVIKGSDGNAHYGKNCIVVAPSGEVDSVELLESSFGVSYGLFKKAAEQCSSDDLQAFEALSLLFVLAEEAQSWVGSVWHWDLLGPSDAYDLYRTIESYPHSSKSTAWKLLSDSQKEVIRDFGVLIPGDK